MLSRKTLKLHLGFLVFSFSNVLWLSSEVGLVSLLLASEAVLSELEVVVVAHAALPSSVWELEFLWRFLLLHFSFGFVI